MMYVIVIIEIVKSVTLRDQKGTLENFFTFDCWGAIYNQHDFTKPHTHGPALWSWCYYIQVPNNAPPLYFREAKLEVYPKPDEIVIFPGPCHTRSVLVIGHDRRKNHSWLVTFI